MANAIYALETQLCARIIIDPSQAVNVATEWLSQLPQEFIELVALAPLLCQSVGIVDYIEALYAHRADGDKPPVVEYARWLAQASIGTLASLASYDAIMTELEQLIKRSLEPEMYAA